MKENREKSLSNLIYSLPILALSFLPMNKAKAQPGIPKPNTISLDAQIGLFPIQGGGIGYSKKLTRNFASYFFLSGGKYKPPYVPYDDYSMNTYLTYIKASAGGMFYQRKDNNHTINPFLSLGIGWNFYNKEHYMPGTMDEKAFRKLSIEGGFGITIKGAVDTGVQYDISKKEARIFTALRFGRH